jgi:hypothetical protein
MESACDEFGGTNANAAAHAARAPSRFFAAYNDAA